MPDNEKDSKPLRFQSAKNIQGGRIKQNMKKQEGNVDTRRALAKISSNSDECEMAYFDNDTSFEIWWKSMDC